jgi:hypothetical protein
MGNLPGKIPGQEEFVNSCGKQNSVACKDRRKKQIPGHSLKKKRS